MIGSDSFISVFGGQPEHTRANLSAHLRAVIRGGYSPVLCAPGTSEALCILPASQAKKDHACGAAHVLDDPAKLGPILKRLPPDLNVALHLGRSRLMLAGAPNRKNHESPPTVESPNGSALWWLTMPDWLHPRLHPPVFLGGWQVWFGDVYALVPPASRPEGAYRLVGGTIPAQPWMLEMTGGG